MQFYTTVARYGNNLLYRGYSDGKRIKKRIKFSPTLYIKATAQTDYHTLEGTPVDPIKFVTISEAREFAKKYESIENFTIYGNQNPIAQFLAQEHPGVIPFNLDWIRIHNIDIEVDSSEGFPHAHEAKYPVVAITLLDSIAKTYYSWGLGEYDSTKAENQNIQIVYTKCTDESDLLLSFIAYFSNEFTCPDIVTGWNSQGFDIPYLVNRISKLLGEDYVKKLSPWGIVKERTVTLRWGETQMYDLVGISQLDYLNLFQKFGLSFGPQENYRLDTIANVVLGERKLSYEEEETLAKLYKSNHQKYLDYNIRDVYLVDRMDDKIAFIELCLTMSYKAGTNFEDAFGTTAIWDQLIHRTLMQDKIVIPPKSNNVKTEFEGAYVKPPQCGAHDWVASFDINSLYPNIIVQWNMSPETISRGVVDSKVTIDSLLNGYVSSLAKSSNASVAATGQLFSNEKQGFLPRIVKKIYDERVVIKKQMLVSAQEYELVDRADREEVYRIERDLGHFKNQQHAIKILLNSVYGAMANAHFRYFEIAIAEGVTLTGQFVIKAAEKATNEYLNATLKTDKDYVLAMDTDSCFLGLGNLVDTIGISDKTKTINFLDKVCAKIESDVFEVSFDKIMKDTNSFEQRISIKRESISDRGIWTAKKRYILNVLDNEGVRYSEPKLKITGIEAIKSSTPAACKVALKKLFKVIISGTEPETQAFIAAFRKEFDQLSPEEKAFPRSVSKVAAHMNSDTIFGKKCPMNSRSAILYNHLLKKHNLENKYQVIKDGEKIKFIYLKPQNPIRQNVIGFYNVLPVEFDLHKYIDNDIQFEKTFLNPVIAILNAIGWKPEVTNTLDNFFGD